MQIRTKFLIVFFATSLLPLIFLAYINFSSGQEVLIKATQDKLETIAELQISKIKEVGDNPALLKAISSDYTSLGTTGEVIMARPEVNGGIMYLNPRRFEDESIRDSSLMMAALNKDEAFFPTATDYRGKAVVAVTRFIPELNMGVVVKIDRDEAFQFIKVLRDNIVIFSFIFILVVVMIAVLFVYSITAPILNLAFVAEQVSAGDLSKRALISSKDEVGELATAFNFMLDGLKESHEDLEKKVQKRTEQLEIANKDLESFSYSVSHDLRAPLRAVDGFSKILAEDYKDKLDDDGQHFLETIRNSTKQMGTLIDDLLSFSRLGRQEVKAADVNMTTLAKSVYDEILLANPGRTIKFTCDELIPAHADPALIRHVWVNFLSNAIKFTRKTNDATISVGSKEENGYIIYHVTDNGAGFDMKYVDKLFLVFQRLHSAEEFEGTGVGLSICARIITKHGGMVWAEGAVDKGATFYFSLPKDIASL